MSASTCEYKVKGDEPGQPQRPCGNPAVYQARTPAGGMRCYCEACASAAEEQCRRQKTRINLIKIVEA